MTINSEMRNRKPHLILLKSVYNSSIKVELSPLLKGEYPKSLSTFFSAVTPTLRVIYEIIEMEL